jgi:hypothetical protein
MAVMIFGEVPSFDTIMISIGTLSRIMHEWGAKSQFR